MCRLFCFSARPCPEEELCMRVGWCGRQNTEKGAVVHVLPVRCSCNYPHPRPFFFLLPRSDFGLFSPLAFHLSRRQSCLKAALRIVIVQVKLLPAAKKMLKRMDVGAPFGPAQPHAKWLLHRRTGTRGCVSDFMGERSFFFFSHAFFHHFFVSQWCARETVHSKEVRL
uniref:Uncharacterized protein n=1 Tax=Trypanosoma vivax (strain Y486) TaxID=1055687 RepID=G0UBA9_TRYVY|nr:hypothetical protein TVY486_1105800 [Trypanosoma vivax Y486]